MTLRWTARWLCTAWIGLSIAVLIYKPAQAELLDQLAKLNGSDSAAGDSFGISVSLWGQTALVGGYWNDKRGTDAGSAYVFRENGVGSWSQVAQLNAGDAQLEDYFGGDVSLYRKTALVGAQFDDDGGRNSGSAYLFRESAAGSWSQIAKLTASDASAEDLFGISVSMNEGLALVGALEGDGRVDDSGCAYLFKEGGAGNWTQIAKLAANDGVRDDGFGRTVSLSGNTALVGSILDDDAGTSSGSAYVFRDDGTGNWRQIAKLRASDAALGNQFGYNVALDENIALVGARFDDDGATDGGRVYVFQEDSSGAWREIDKFIAGDPTPGDQFGLSLSLQNGVALIGATGADAAGNFAGRAYLFRDDGQGDWYQYGKLTPEDAAAGDFFGVSVSLYGGKALVGSFQNDDRGLDSGSAYLFDARVPEPASVGSAMVAVCLLWGSVRTRVRQLMARYRRGGRINALQVSRTKRGKGLTASHSHPD